MCVSGCSRDKRARRAVIEIKHDSHNGAFVCRTILNTVRHALKPHNIPYLPAESDGRSHLANIVTAIAIRCATANTGLIENCTRHASIYLNGQDNLPTRARGQGAN